MIRIVDGIAYLGEPGSTFSVRAVELGNGHLEVSAVRDTAWKELSWEPQVMSDHLEKLRLDSEDADLLAEKAARALKMAANRAKTRVRRLCKAMGADTLLTLTYRANELDLDRVKRDLKEFNRRMCRELSSFRFVAAFEKQARGAWHCHLATAGIPAAFLKRGALGKLFRVKSFDVIRAVWRSVTKDRGGTINVSRRKSHSLSSAAKIAAYLSKYVTKDFAVVDKGVNRYAAYGAPDIPRSVLLGRVGSPLEAVEVCYSLCGDRVVFSQHYSRFGDWFFLHAENAPPIKSPLPGVIAV